MAEEFTEDDWQELLKYTFSKDVANFLNELHETNNTPVHVHGRFLNRVNVQLLRQRLPFRLMATDHGGYWPNRVCRMYRAKDS